MAEVRDFSTYAGKFNSRKKAGASGRQTSYKEKIRSHKVAVFVRAVVISAFVITLATVIYVSWRDKHYSEAVTVEGVKISTESDAKIVDLNGYIVQYSKDGARCIDSSGKAVWDQTYEMQEPKACTCMNSIAIGDKSNGHEIYVSNTGGFLAPIETDLPIIDFCVSSQGVVAAVLDGVDVTWIYLYDSQGKVIAYFMTTMKDSGYPLDIGISPNGELVCVSYLLPEDGQAMTKVAFYNFGEVGQNDSDNLVSGYNCPGEVVPEVEFMGGDKAFAVSDGRVIFFSGAQKPVAEKTDLLNDEEIISVFHNDSYVGLVFEEEAGEGKYRLQVYTSSGNKVLGKTGEKGVSTCYFDMDYSDIIFTNKQIVIYNDNEYMLMDMNGRVKYQGTFDEPVRTMIPTGAMNKFFVVTEDSIDTLLLK
ncbi:MAG: hypothetical protein J5802_08615 [Butyrivibrio sp.]|nr:hypothetical protein [Butyrivibrio sp.]